MKRNMKKIQFNNKTVDNRDYFVYIHQRINTKCKNL